MAAGSSRGSLGLAAGPTPDPGGLRRYEAPRPPHRRAGASAFTRALGPRLGAGLSTRRPARAPATRSRRWRSNSVDSGVAVAARADRPGGQLGQSRARPEHGSGQSIIDGAARLDAMIPARPSPIEPGWLRGPIEMWRRLTPFGSGAGPEPPQGRRLTEGAFHGPRDPLARASPRR